jgi:hypothetical protein
MKLPVRTSEWIGLMAAVNNMASPGAGPLLALMPLLGLVGSAATQLKRALF